VRADTSFRLVRSRGEPAALFAGSPSEFGGVPTVVHRSATRPALVLGSTQPASIVAADVPVDVVRRRSGGGAVLVEPESIVWVDVFVPAGHPLWQADVGRAFWWLGDAWAAALADLGVPDAVVHRGPLVTSRWSPLICFAGLGPGEVTAGGAVGGGGAAGADGAGGAGGAGGGKVVGIAQRRTREGSLFQCALARSWSAERMLALFELPLEQFEQGLSELEHVVAPLEREPEECLLALFEHLP